MILRNKDCFDFIENISLEIITEDQSRVPVESQESERNVDDSCRIRRIVNVKAFKTTLIIFPFVIIILLYLVYIGGGKF